MADTITAPTPDTTKQTITGPDGKQYKFSKGISQARIDKYFAAKGIKKVETKPFVPTGPDPGKVKQSMMTGTTGNVVEASSAALPTVGAAVGGMLTGGRGPTAAVGAGLGGAIGEDVRQMIMRPILLGRGEQDLTAKQSLMNMASEGVKQAALQYTGEKAGDYFFKLLDKIPHAIIKKGIPLLPSDLNPNSKVMRYVEDLLTNLAPSAKTMNEFKVRQSAKIVDKVSKLANGFAKFDGTSEEMGVLLQKALRDGRESAEQALDKLRQSLPAGKRSVKDLAKAFPNEYQDFVQTYENELTRSILKTNKPELIGGLLRSSRAALNETRIVIDVMHELSPETLGKVQNRILRDALSEAIVGSKDPVAKGTKNLAERYAGGKFKSVIDVMGEERLKAIYGEQGYKRIEDFVKLTGGVGNNQQGSGVGRFLNLMFLMPFRGGVSGASLGKLSGSAFIFNRVAHVITSPEGMRVYENGIRAVAANAPRAANLAFEEMRTMAEQADKEYAMEEKEAEQEYLKSKENKTK